MAVSTKPKSKTSSRDPRPAPPTLSPPSPVADASPTITQMYQAILDVQQSIRSVYDLCGEDAEADRSHPTVGFSGEAAYLTDLGGAIDPLFVDLKLSLCSYLPGWPSRDVLEQPTTPYLMHREGGKVYMLMYTDDLRLEMAESVERGDYLGLARLSRLVIIDELTA